jgi:hypothetical protein
MWTSPGRDSINGQSQGDPAFVGWEHRTVLLDPDCATHLNPDRHHSWDEIQHARFQPPPENDGYSFPKICFTSVVVSGIL